MKCSNCGHENDADAKFCEKCGSNLNKSSVPTSTKMLIIVAIAICAVLGMGASAYIMTASHIAPISISTNNSTNQNNATASANTNNGNSTSNNNSGNGSNNNQSNNSGNSGSTGNTVNNTGSGNQ